VWEREASVIPVRFPPLFLLAALTVLPAAASAQEAPLPPAGRVLARILDAATDQAVEGVAVRIIDLDLPARISNLQGRVIIAGVPAGLHEVEIRHIAYGITTQLVNIPPGDDVSITARLSASAIALDSIEVVVRPRLSHLQRVGFLERQKRGFGYFFAGEDIDAWRVDQALLSVPFVTVRLVGAGLATRATMRVAGRACVPDIYVDGVRQVGSDGDVRQVVTGLELAAMEVYRGSSVPVEFRRSMSACGVIVIWRQR
jgi:hypothetical protein